MEEDGDGAGDGVDEDVLEVTEETGVATEAGKGGAAEVTFDTAGVATGVAVVVVTGRGGNGGTGGAGTVTVGAGGRGGGGGSRPAVAVPASSAEAVPTASQTSSRMWE